MNYEELLISRILVYTYLLSQSCCRACRDVLNMCTQRILKVNCLQRSGSDRKKCVRLPHLPLRYLHREGKTTLPYLAFPCTTGYFPHGEEGLCVWDPLLQELPLRDWQPGMSRLTWIRGDELPETDSMSKSERYLEWAEWQGRRKCRGQPCHF